MQASIAPSVVLIHEYISSISFSKSRVCDYSFRGGVCIWAASYPGNAASVRPGVSQFVGTISRGTGIRWTLVDCLKSTSNEHITALAWSPDGRYPYDCP